MNRTEFPEGLGGVFRRHWQRYGMGSGRLRGRPASEAAGAKEGGFQKAKRIRAEIAGGISLAAEERHLPASDRKAFCTLCRQLTIRQAACYNVQDRTASEEAPRRTAVRYAPRLMQRKKDQKR